MTYALSEAVEADLERAVNKVTKAEAEAARLQKVLDDAASQTKQVRQALLAQH